MAGSLFVLPRVTPLNGSVGVPLSKLTFSRTGTTTAQDTYTDSALTTPNENPVVADANGMFPKIYLDPSTGYDYRVKWTTSADVLIWQEDDIKAGNTVSASYTLTDTAPYIDLIETDATANNGGWRIQANNEQLIIYAMDDAKAVFTALLTLTRTSTALFSTGSFTLGFTGFSADPPSNAARYAITGNHVALQLNFSTGTSNATTFTLTGLPASIRPARKQSLRIPSLVDNGTTLSTGHAVVNTDGTISLHPSDSTVNWTNSGDKGMSAGTSTYATLVYPIA